MKVIRGETTVIRTREEKYREILKACPDIGINIARRIKYSYGGSFNELLKSMVKKGLIEVSWEPPQGFTDRKRHRVKVYRITNEGRIFAGIAKDN